MSRMRIERLLVDDAVIELGQFRAIPTLGGTYKVARDALQLVYMGTTTLGTSGEFLVCIFVSTLHATIAIVIHRAVTNVVLVHEIDDIHDSLRVVGSIAINLNIEDVSATSEVVIGSLDLGLMLG